MSVRTSVGRSVRKVSGKVGAFVSEHVVEIHNEYGAACDRRHL